jgi:tetratricopeptide (TPR) repeat protein
MMKFILLSLGLFALLIVPRAEAKMSNDVFPDRQTRRELHAQWRWGTPIPTTRPEVVDAINRENTRRQQEAEAWARSPHNLENQDPEIRGLGRFDRYSFYVSRGKEKYDKNDFQGAMSDYNKAVYCYPDHSQVYNNRGVLKAKLNDFPGALEDCNLADRLAIRRIPKADISYNRGILKIRMNDRAGAIQDLRQAARWYQQEGETQYYQEAVNELRLINATL